MAFSAGRMAYPNPAVDQDIFSIRTRGEPTGLPALGSSGTRVSGSPVPVASKGSRDDALADRLAQAEPLLVAFDRSAKD